MRPGVNATGTRNATTEAPRETTMASTALPATTGHTPLVGHALRPARPTGGPVSLDARPVLIPILSSVVCFPIVAFAVICALRYRALRLRRKEHLRRLRGGGMRATRLEIPGREKPSLFSRDSSSGDTNSRPPGQDEERRSTVGPVPSSSSDDDDDDDFTSDVAVGGRPLDRKSVV